MSLAFIAVDTATNMVTQTGYSPMKWITSHSVFSTTLDDSDSVYQAIVKNQTSQSYDNFMSGRPYLKGSYDGTNLTVTLFNPPSPAPTSATLSILGQTFTVTITNNAITFPVSIHPSVTAQSIECAVIVEGFTPIYVQLGGNSNNITVQLGKDSSGVLHVVPYYNADLVEYFNSNSFNAVYQPVDIATITGLDLSVIFGKVLQSLQQPTYTPITLTADEQNGVNDVLNNVIPNIPANLANIAPVGKPFNLHWNSYRSHVLDAQKATTNYEADAYAISQYVQLH